MASGRLHSFVKVLGSNPSYIFGRFRAVRKAYAGLRHVGQKLHDVSHLEFGDKYATQSVRIDLARCASVLFDEPAGQMAEAVRRKSWSAGLRLAPDFVQAIHQFAQRAPLIGQDVKLATYAALAATKDSTVAIATVETAHECPEIAVIAADQDLYQIIAQVLGYKPRRASCWLFWSFAKALSEDQRRQQYQTIDFHYDVHGYSFVYVNFYLTNTTSQDGAHVLIEGSHSQKSLKHLLGSARLSDDEAISAYGNSSVRTIEAPAGAGFIEDTSCYHKALPPRQNERLMLQLRYT